MPAARLMVWSLGRRRPCTMCDPRSRPSVVRILTDSKENLAKWLLSLYLGLAPLYWLPGVSSSTLRVFEWTVAMGALGLVFGAEARARRLPFPRGLMGPLGFAVFTALWSPGLLKAAAASESIGFLLDLGGSCAVLWCLVCMARQGVRTMDVFVRALAIVVAISGIALVHEVVGLALWTGISDGYLELYAGFGVRSTGWSVALAYFLPIAALVYSNGIDRESVSWVRLGLLASAVILGNQILSGGRSGLLASLTVLAVLVLHPAARRLGVLVALVGIVILGGLCLDQSCTDHLKLSQLEALPAALSDADSENSLVVVRMIDEMSTNRYSGLVLGARMFADDPLVGTGLGQFKLDSDRNQPVEIHNLWLQWAVYTGFLAPLWFMVMIWSVLRRARQLRSDRSIPHQLREEIGALALVVIAGLAMSLVEPSVPLGKNVSAIWWAAAGTIVGMSERLQPERPKRKTGTARA